MGKIKLEKTKPIKFAYIEHVGSYGEIPFNEYIPRLYAWAKEKKVRPGFKTIGIFYDSPEKTPSEECRSEIGIPIKGEANPDEEIKIKELLSMEVATIKHKAPASEYGETYKKLAEWMEENGYEWAGPAVEVYTKKPKVVGNETIIYATVQVPVKKK
ncbi:MAG: GyrI-like domain-containing protein [Candidatus Thermoplasmatota archaeon]|nr:GyrI-like domain-containing protein [Candidatus Thermoplasmatota archaeon]